MKIFRNILALFRGLLLVISMTLYLLVYAVTRIFLSHTRESGLKLRRAWITQMAYPLMNLDVEITGKAIDRPALYVSNHRTFTDPVVMSKFVDAFIIAKAEIADYPIINKGAEVTGIIWVKRDNKTSRDGARKEFIEVIKQGYNIMVYPEGTVSTTAQTLPFKKGTFYEAAKENIPVVPIAIEYRDPRDLWTVANVVGQYMVSFGKWKTEVKMVIGPEIVSKDGEEIAKHCEQWVNEQLQDMREGWSLMSF